MLGTAHVEKAPRAHPLAFPHNENEAARTVPSVNLTQRLDAHCAAQGPFAANRLQ